MDLLKRKKQLQEDLEKARQQLTIWATNVQQLTGGIAIIDEQLIETQKSPTIVEKPKIG